MQETEAVVRLALQLAPIGERLRQHDEGSHHVGLDEGGGAVDRAVDVAFGGQMQDGVGSKSIERRPDGGAITNVGAHKGISWIADDRRERGKVAGVGELVEHENVVALADRATNYSRTDEARAACNQQPHADPLLAKVVPTPSEAILSRLHEGNCGWAWARAPNGVTSSSLSSLRPGQFSALVNTSCSGLSQRAR